MDDMKFLTVEKMAKILHIGKSKAYELVKEPGFPSVKVGKQIRIIADELCEYLKNKSD